MRHESRAVADELFRFCPVGTHVFQYRRPGRLVLIDANPAAERITGSTLAEWQGKEFDEIWPAARAAGITETLLRLAQTGTSPEQEEFEYRDERLEVAVRMRAFRLADSRLAVAFHDVSRLLKAERRLRQERAVFEECLHHTQKLEAIGTLASGVAHDMNNVLGGVMMFAGLIATTEKTEHERQQAAGAVLDLCQRGRRLTGDLLRFARRTPHQPEWTSVSRLVGSVASLIQSTIPKTIRVRLECDQGVGAIWGDQDRLYSLFTNLCTNAVDAMSEVGELTLRCQRRELDEATAPTRPNACSGTYVCVSVSDTGSGMDVVTRARAIEPFFTTKPAGAGTGLGLSMADSIARGHEGWLVIDSEPGAGTTVSVWLPEHRQDAPATKRPVEYSACSGTRQGRVVVADDETVVRILMRRVLERAGYEVFVAADGEEALRACREHRGDLSALVLDVGMPRLGGRDVLRMLCQEQPDLKILVVSGHCIEDGTDEWVAQGAAGVLNKPFGPEGLLTSLDRVLGEQPQGV